MDMPDENPSKAEENEETERGGGLSRRMFLKFLLGTSIILTFIPFAPMVRYFFSKKMEEGSSRKRIANVRELPEGSTKVFFYPGEEDVHRSFLVHLPRELADRARAEGRDEFITKGFIALNTICTHLQCPSDFPEEDQIICPCHGGYFSLLDGTVIAGPPPRPLPAIRLEVDDDTGDIYAIELVDKIGYGRE